MRRTCFFCRFKQQMVTMSLKRCKLLSFLTYTQQKTVAKFTFSISSFKSILHLVTAWVAKTPKIVYHGTNSKLEESTTGSEDLSDSHEFRVLMMVYSLFHNIANRNSRQVFYRGYALCKFQKLCFVWKTWKTTSTSNPVHYPLYLAAQL